MQSKLILVLFFLNQFIGEYLPVSCKLFIFEKFVETMAYARVPDVFL
jgi:hypothetical protein